MSEISAWKIALTAIIEQLDKSQYKKMLQYLEKIPKHLKTPRSREQMAQTIIEHYGEQKSVSVIRDVMIAIPRRDAVVQDRLRPFGEKLKEEKKGEKRKSEADSRSAGFKRNNIVSESESSDGEQEAEAGKKRRYETEAERKQQPAAGFKKNKIVSESESSGEEQEVETDDLKSDSSDKEREIPPWRKSIQQLKISGDSEKKLITGKVVQKSGLRTYQTKKKEKKFFFNLGVADETDSIKVMVYGRERFQDFEEGCYYNFRETIMDENLLKVTKLTKISTAPPLDVPKQLELEAQMLIYIQAPVRSIGKSKVCGEKTLVSVEGTVKEIGLPETVKSKRKRREDIKTVFKLEDDSGSIGVTLWGKDTSQLRGTSVGDFVRVINVKTHHYYDSVSLNSTDYTRITKVQSAAVQNVSVQIVGIIKAGRIETELDGEMNGQVHTFVVDSSRLAKAFGVRLQGDFQKRLLKKMPFSAKAEIRGNKIKKLTAANEM
ncbi:uncharacterized protein PAE49_018538 [Odontesthes bonariensis]|uniref:uncharacterized protein LOC142401611 n=1 Tax=Odontesthes bonariensis TaxID=219752 RepID=UPI003F584C4A